MNKKSEEKISFEDAIEELEGISSTLAEGMLPLEESLKLFERGIYLKKLCSLKLEEAEKKIKILAEDENGGLREEEFDG